MPGSFRPPPAALLELLPQWVAEQRWYGGKGRVPVLRSIGGVRLEDPAGEADIDVHLLLDESTAVPSIYQVPLTSRGAPLTDGDHALVTTIDGQGESPGAVRHIYDAPHDPAFVNALLSLVLDEGKVASQQEQRTCAARGHRLATQDPGRLAASRVLTGEQSNTSVILDLVDDAGAPSKPLICKLFRVLHDGANPDVVVQSALATTGSTRVPRSVGYVSGQWPDANAPDGLAQGHLAFVQEFLPGVRDAWRVTLEAIASGTDFSRQAHSLGLATAQVHKTLAQVMGTQAATAHDVLALTARMRARHAAARTAVAALAEYDAMVDACIEAVSQAEWPALQRIHGDYHLGQVLEAPGRGWVLIDFEGEPLRPLAERTQPDLALRDVAGMLRSFDYVAGSWEQAHPSHSDQDKVDAQAWAHTARTAFLEGYTSGAGRDPRDDAVLLNALELDKALYEVVYEARNRPTWLSIPTTAIARLARLARQDRLAPTAETAPMPAGPRSDLRS